jgi:ArsR family transcriptional regulator
LQKKVVTLTKRIQADKMAMIVNMLKIISHPVRLDIVDLLSRKTRLTVMEVQEQLGLEQPVASHHITLMEDKGVLVSEKLGRNKYIRLRFPKMQKIIECMEGCCELM